MSEKKLNLNLIEQVMMEKGISQQTIADKVGVSKGSVSSWLKPEKFPRPNHLYKLAKFLELEFKELVIKVSNEPNLVAFRKSGNYKITDYERKQFQYRANLLEKLVPFASVDLLSLPPTLSNPSLDYEYIQEVAGRVRSEINPSDGKIKFQDLIEHFKDLHATLIPVLWGKSKKHGTHVLLPESKTNWVFINLDSKLFDFLFWMSHELGHSKAPYLEYEDGEEFADSFAGALLFPKEFAKEAYDKISSISDQWKRVDEINSIAIDYVISPITIYKEIEKYAKWSGEESLELHVDQVIFRGTTKFNSNFKSVSELIFEESVPSTEEYLNVCRKEFKTDFFDILKSFLSSNSAITPKYVADILDISVSDAHEIWGELIEDGPK